MRWIHNVGCALAAAGVFGSLAGCASSAPDTEPVAVDEAAVEAETARLLAPFDGDLAVLADEVLVEMTPNFRENIVHYKQREDLHRHVDDEVDAHYEQRWINDSGGELAPVQIRVQSSGDTELGGGAAFAAVHRLRLRVLKGTHPFTLRVTATGNVTVADGDQPLESLQSIQFDDGRVRRQ